MFLHGLVVVLGEILQHLVQAVVFLITELQLQTQLPILLLNKQIQNWRK